MIGHAMAGAASFTIYTRTKEFFRDHHLVDHSKLLGCAAVGGIGGAMAGALISFGSAREFCRPVPILSTFLILMTTISFRTRQGTRASAALSARQLLTMHLLAGSAAVRIYDCREEGNQVGEAPEYRLCCAGHFQIEWSFWVVHWLLPSLP
jgi:hypothetical protein